MLSNYVFLHFPLNFGWNSVKCVESVRVEDGKQQNDNVCRIFKRNKKFEYFGLKIKEKGKGPPSGSPGEKCLTLLARDDTNQTSLK